MQNFGDNNPADFTLQDATIPDQDVAQAMATIPNLANLGCIASDTLAGNIVGIAVDLSVSPAALGVIVANTSDLDPNNFCIPASFGGVPVEQEVIETLNNSGDTTGIGIGSF